MLDLLPVTIDGGGMESDTTTHNKDGLLSQHQNPEQQQQQRKKWLVVGALAALALMRCLLFPVGTTTSASTAATGAEAHRGLGGLYGEEALDRYAGKDNDDVNDNDNDPVVVEGTIEVRNKAGDDTVPGETEFPTDAPTAIPTFSPSDTTTMQPTSSTTDFPTMEPTI